MPRSVFWMAEKLALRFDDLQHVVHDATEILECGVVDQALAVCLIDQLGIAVAPNFDESHHLVVAEANNRVIYTSLVEPKPVVVRLTVRPDAKTVTINANS